MYIEKNIPQESKDLCIKMRKIGISIKEQRLAEFVKKINDIYNEFQRKENYLLLATRLYPYWTADRESRYLMPALQTNNKELATSARDAFGKLRDLKNAVRGYYRWHR
jgi:hypothetical protein